MKRVMRMRYLGFTLIEVVVVIGILSVLIGGGVATLIPFKERREVLSSARNVASFLKQIQIKASSVEIPASCDVGGVSEFEVIYSEGSMDLLIKSPDGSTCEQDEEILSLANGTEFIDTGSVVFRVPFGSATPAVIGICNYGVQYDLEIMGNGSVSEPRKSVLPGC